MNVKVETVVSLIGQILIPVLVAFVTYVIARKQIANAGVTQFRQNWIDNLRDSISDYIAKAEMISMLDLGTKSDELYFEHFKELSRLQHKIELLLNPNEKDHVRLTNLIGRIRDLIHDEDLDEEQMNDSLDDLLDQLLHVSKKVLKREWSIVKEGK